MKKNTKLIHLGQYHDGTGSVSVPIYHSSTFKLKDLDTEQKYEYSRTGNPTREALEAMMAELEEGIRGFAFSSGMAAISSVFMTFKAGDHILVSRDVYGGTYRALKEVFEGFNLQVSYVDCTNQDEVIQAIRPHTKAIYVESPTNPLLKIVDLKSLAAIARDHKLITVIDNTFMTPYLQRPLTLGIDIVIHSATKYIGGHSDVLGGLVVVKDEALARKIYTVQKSVGAVLSPHDCWLLLRGLKTLGVRMDRQQENTDKLTRWLLTRPEVKQVYYPGLEDHPGHQICRFQASGFGAVLCFELFNETLAESMITKLKYITLGASLGGVESLISIPAKMSHSFMPPHERKQVGINDGLVRLSVGIEDIEDLKEDFLAAWQ